MKKSILFVLATSALSSAYAAESGGESIESNISESTQTCDVEDENCTTNNDQLKSSDVMVVHAPVPVPVNGNTYYDSVDINRLPTRNGNISDLLKTNPTVRFNDSQNSSLNQGSIDPQNISFHGASPYQNLFLIDGISTTNTLDPANTNMNDNGTNIVGNSQGYYLDISLLDSIRVYDSNVPVEYGQFNGGVIDARLRRFSGDDSVKVSFRTTRDSWARAHITEKDRDDYEAGGNGSIKVYSPTYSKYFYTLSVDKQIADNLGFTLGLSHRESNVTRNSGLNSLNGSTRNTDDINTLLSKISWLASDNATHDFTIKYNQANHEIQTSNFIDSGRDMGSEAYGLAWEYEQYVNSGKLKFNIGWDHMENYTENARNSLRTEIPCVTVPGVTNCTIGGQGHISQEMDIITTKARWDIDEFNLGQTTHNVYLGGDFAHIYAQTERHNDSETYQLRNGVVSNHFKYRTGKGSVTAQQYALYIADTIQFGRFAFTPGLRYDYETFLDNHNIAPRIRAELDVFGDHKTMITSGYNRYYGTGFYNMKLQADRSSWKYNAVTGAANGLITTNYKDLDTPYSDEWTIGLQQQVAGIVVGLNYVNRKERDQFSLLNKGNNKTYNNDGSSETDSYNLSIMPVEPYKISMVEVMPQFVLSYMDTKGNLSLDVGYNDTEATNYDQVVYNGKLMDYDDVPIRDYNTPWVISMNLDFAIPDYGLTWANTIKYQSGQDSRIIARTVDSCYNTTYGSSYRQYCDVSLSSNVVWDARLAWQPHFIKDQPLTISVDILNVLDKENTIPYNSKSAITSSSGNLSAYGPGRQIWLQVDYTF